MRGIVSNIHDVKCNKIDSMLKTQLFETCLLTPSQMGDMFCSVKRMFYFDLDTKVILKDCNRLCRICENKICECQNLEKYLAPTDKFDI